MKKLVLAHTVWDYLDSLSNIKNHYELDFVEENKDVIDYLNDLRMRKDKLKPIDLDKVKNDVKEFWEKLILNFVGHLLDEIMNRDTKGAEFAKIKIDLEKIKVNLPYDDFGIRQLKKLYEENLKECNEVIKEKIQIEKTIEELNKNNLKHIEEITKKSIRRGRIQGFFMSIIAGLIVGYILYKLGYV